MSAEIIAASAAVIAAVVSWAGYALSRKLYNKAEADERFVFGTPHRLDLDNLDHDSAVIGISVFNKSHRKAYIKQVTMTGTRGDKIDIKWGNETSHLGNIGRETGLVGVVDVETLYVRTRDSSAFPAGVIEVGTSFSDAPVTVEYDPYGEFE